MSMSSVKSIFITGASRGIGLEFVKQFINLSLWDCSIIFAACRNPDNAKDLADLASGNKHIRILKMDTTDTRSIQEAFEAVKCAVGTSGLNLLINNAGITIRQNLDNLTVEGMEETYRTNTIGPLITSQTFLPLLRSAAGEHKDVGMSIARAAIVNISTIKASIGMCNGGAYPYRTSKAALNMATRAMAMDLKSHGILVTCLHPGWLNTDMGGPRADATTHDGVEGMLKVIQGLKEEDTGRFYDYTGKELPW